MNGFRSMAKGWLFASASIAASAACAGDPGYSLTALPSTYRSGAITSQIVYHSMSHRGQVLAGLGAPLVDPGSRGFLYQHGRKRVLAMFGAEDTEDSATYANSRGDAIGASGPGLDDTIRSLRWHADGTVDMLLPGSDANAVVWGPTQLSEAGVASGAVVDFGAGRGEAALWERVEPVILPRPAGHDDEPFAAAIDISPDGRYVAGTLSTYAYSAPSALVVWHDRQPTIYVNLGPDVELAPNGINDRGEAAATAGSTAYELDASGRLNALPVLQTGTQAFALAINAQGWVAGGGDCQCAQTWHAVIWRDGQPTDVNDLLEASARAAGWVIEWVDTIDDTGALFAIAVNTLDPLASSYVLLTPSRGER